MNELKEKQNELKKLQEQQGEEANQKIEQVRKDIQQRELEVDKDINRLPFGVLSSGASVLNAADGINYEGSYITFGKSTGQDKDIIQFINPDQNSK